MSKKSSQKVGKGFAFAEIFQGMKKRVCRILSLKWRKRRRTKEDDAFNKEDDAVIIRIAQWLDS